MQQIRMPDLNNVVIAGNLTRDPSFRKTTNGTSVTNFSIASNRRFKDNNGQWRESVCYVGVVVWYKLAENCAEHLHRGSTVLIEGELQSRSFRSDEGRNRNIVEIKARRVQFLNMQDEGVEINDKDAVEEMNIATIPVDSSVSEEDVKQNKTDEKEDDTNKGEFDFGYQNLKL